jgi:hypothetical protein
MTLMSGGKVLAISLTRLDRVDRGQRVGARGELDADAGTGLAVPLGIEAVIFGPDLHPGDVAQAHHRCVGVALQADLRELIGRRQARLDRDGGVEHLLLGRRACAQLSGRDLRILRADRGRHVIHGQRIFVELHRIDQMRIAYCEPKIWVSPTPFTRDSGSCSFDTT